MEWKLRKYTPMLSDIEVIRTIQRATVKPLGGGVIQPRFVVTGRDNSAKNGRKVVVLRLVRGSNSANSYANAKTVNLRALFVIHASSTVLNLLREFPGNG